MHQLVVGASSRRFSLCQCAELLRYFLYTNIALQFLQYNLTLVPSSFHPRTSLHDAPAQSYLPRGCPFGAAGVEPDPRFRMRAFQLPFKLHKPSEYFLSGTAHATQAINLESLKNARHTIFRMHPNVQCLSSFLAPLTRSGISLSQGHARGSAED